MISYGKDPENQQGIEAKGIDGYDLMCEAREWLKAHPEAFDEYMRIARAEHASAGVISPNFCLQMLRHTVRISVKNAYAPAFARIALETDGSLNFRLAKSKTDGYVGVVL